ncbi:aldo/keto reductase [Campylobacter majalis]|uniref:aldo/keto reductase n=1 Tax=Campylobacter majalis TaxID=2790656 RepID=UPI003D68B60A
MQKRKLGQIQVGAMGLGCMGISQFLGVALSKDEGINLLHEAFELGIDFYDTAEVYGPFVNEEILGEAFKNKRDKVKIATKFGFNIQKVGNSYQMAGLNSDPKHIISAVEGSLKRLKTDYIDIIYQHRVDPNVPIEDVAGVVGDLIKQGKARAFGLSEASIGTLKRANAVTPVSAMQSEFSMWWQEPKEKMFDELDKIGAGFVAFSPLGRGFLTGNFSKNADLNENDSRKHNPRFSDEAMSANKALLDFLDEISTSKNATKSQIALAWTLAQSDIVVPIPGTKKLSRLKENLGALKITLNKDELQQIQDKLDRIQIIGHRYTAAQDSMVDR